MTNVLASSTGAALHVEATHSFLYLALALSLIAPVLLTAVLRPALRRKIARMALYGAVWGPFAEYWYTRDYWHPIGVFGNAWLEDTLYGAGFFALSSVAPDLVSHRRLRGIQRASHRKAFLALPLAYAVSMVLFSVVAGWNSIIVACAFGTAAVALMLARRRDLRSRCLTAALSMLAVAVLVYSIGLDAYRPGARLLPKIWLLDGQPLGVRVLGNIPLTELVFYLVWGGAVGIFYEYAYGFHVTVDTAPSP